MRPWSLAFFAFAALGLAACASDEDRSDSPDYSAGYADGCTTGSSRGAHPPYPVTRDNNAFAHNADYKAGWRTGYNACLVRSGNDPLGR